jgi:hypothetical protein
MTDTDLPDKELLVENTRAEIERYKTIKAEVNRVSGAKVVGCRILLEAQNSVHSTDEILLTAAQKAVDDYVQELVDEAASL